MQYRELLRTPKKSLTGFLLMTLLVWSLGVPSFVHKANAASLRWVSDTLGDSASSTPSDHTVVFTTPSGLSAAQAFTVQFDPTTTDFDLSAVDQTDIDIATTTNDGLPIVAGAPGALQWGFTKTGDTMTFTAGAGVTLAANATATIQIGTNAAGGIANAQLVNPGTIGSYIIRITTPVDAADTRVYITDSVWLTAAVDTIFEFEIGGLDMGATVNGTAVTLPGSTTSLPFGVLAVDDDEVIGQELRVKTNATHGFAVTVQADSHLLSATGADIDPFIASADDTDIADPTTWAAPVPVVDDARTYGHEGLTTEDADLATDTLDANDAFAANEWVGNFVDAPRTVFAHNGPITWTTYADNPNKAITQVAYRIQISALQEAATDYTQRLNYVATPVF